MSTIDELTYVLRLVFADESIEVTPQTTADDIDGWDSMSHVTLLMAIEDHFDLEFAPSEVMNLPDVGALVNLVEAKQRG